MLATLLCALVVQRSQTGYAEPVHGLQVLLQLRLHEQVISTVRVVCQQVLSEERRQNMRISQVRQLRAVTLLTCGMV